MTGEEAESHLIAGLLVLFCRIFITLRGHALIMHGYMAPQTSQCLTGGEKRQNYRVTYSRIKKVYSLTECIRLSLCYSPQPAIHPLLITYLHILLLICL